MHPVFLQIGSFMISWYGVLTAIGFMMSMFWLMWLGPREGRSVELPTNLLFWVMLSGIVGARLAHVVSEWGTYRYDLIGIFKLYQSDIFKGYFCNLIISKMNLFKIFQQCKIYNTFYLIIL